MSAAIVAEITRAIEAQLPGARVTARGGGGHFTVEVIDASFAGKPTLQRHRAVLRAIASLMSGDDAPVHAVDTIVAKTPDE